MPTASATTKTRPKVTRKKPLNKVSSSSTPTDTEVTKKVTRKRPTVTKGPKATTPPAPAKKIPPKKKVVKKAPVKSSEPSETTPTGGGRQMGEHGFVVGTDSALIAEALIEGGTDRNNVNDLAELKISEVNGLKNRNGGEKYVPTMVSGVLTKMLKTGNYEVEATWRLVPKEAPAKPAKKAVKPRRTSK